MQRPTPAGLTQMGGRERGAGKGRAAGRAVPVRARERVCAARLRAHGRAGARVLRDPAHNRVRAQSLERQQ